MKPKYIAICAQPHHGKDTVQEILHRLYGIQPIDDGLPLRQACMALFGLDIEQVTTQAGKESFVEVCGQEWQVRKILGDLGKLIEQHFGEMALPQAARYLAESQRTSPDQVFSFSSVRRNQALDYKEHGGIAIQVVRPDIEASPYDFDQYPVELMDYTIWNDGGADDWHDVLVENVRRIFDPIMLGTEDKAA